MLKQDILGFEITMDDFPLFEKLERDENLNSESSNELHIEPVVAVALDELVEVVAEQLEDDAHVAAKSKEVPDLDDVGSVFGVVLADCQQNLNFDLRLVVVTFLILDNLQCQHFLLLVIEHLEHLAIGALAQVLHQFISVGDMIVQHIFVLSITVVVYYFLLANLLPLPSTMSDEIDLVEFFYLSSFVPRKVVWKSHQHLIWSQRKVILLPFFFRTLQ